MNLLKQWENKIKNEDKYNQKRIDLSKRFWKQFLIDVFCEWKEKIKKNKDFKISFVYVKNKVLNKKKQVFLKKETYKNLQSIFWKFININFEIKEVLENTKQKPTKWTKRNLLENLKKETKSFYKENSWDLLIRNEEKSFMKIVDWEVLAPWDSRETPLEDKDIFDEYEKNKKEKVQKNNVDENGQLLIDF